MTATEAPHPLARRLVSTTIAVLATLILIAAGTTIASILFRIPDWVGAVQVNAYVGVGMTAIAMVASVVASRQRLVPLMGIAIVLAVLALIMFSWIIWWEHVDTQFSESLVQGRRFLGRGGGVMTILAVCLVYSGGFCLLQTRSRVISVLRYGLIGLAWFLGLIIATLIVAADLIERLPWAMLVLMALYATAVMLASGTVSIPVIARRLEQRRIAVTESLPDSLRVEMTCPRCGVEAAWPTGPQKCRGCGFTMTIEVEEPRCDCGYLLFALVGTTCPECGRDVPEAARWRAPDEATAGSSDDA